MAAPSTNLCGLCHSHTPLLPVFNPTLYKSRVSISGKYNKKCHPHYKINCLSNEASTVTVSVPEIRWSRNDGYTDKQTVLNYLKSAGFETEELEELELPLTVDVMKERVQFLQKLGLTIDDINEYPLMLACSVKKNMVPVLDYLQKVGVRKSALTDMLRRYPQVLLSSVVIDLQPVIKYLGGLDIKANQIPRVIETFPELLGFKLEGTMSTSVAYLISIGVSRRAIGPMLTQFPQILAMRVGRIIKPFVDYVISLGMSKQVLASVLEKKPYILGFGLENQVKKNVDSMLSFGVRKQALGSVIAEYPEILGFELKAKLMSQMEFLDLNLGIGSEGFPKVLEKMPQVAALSQDPVLKRIELLSSWGFSRKDMRKMVLACPQLLAFNVDVMKLSFDYFRDEMRGSLQELVEFPAYFTYSLETRVKPRFRKISKKGIKCSLSWFLSCTDQRFEERLQAEYIGIEEMGDETSRLAADESVLEEGEGSEDYEESEDELDEIAYKRALYM
ncbi:hypothetical protein KI387_026644 [Taxus chinensis]|uniref:Transcription termination factor MTERF4, chloroplastic n=1 Tax=Taxus chinensis TaxID=29808 RepID=A0AA38FZ26_TAXCH|nr:hypothetical protein KI387_026644 [Taxus chinensis]